MPTIVPEKLGPRLKPADIVKAQSLWAQYQQSHDVSTQQNQVAGIDPQTGRIWFGKTGLDIAHQQDAEGEVHPLYMVTVGKEYFVQKGGRR